MISREALFAEARKRAVHWNIEATGLADRSRAFVLTRLAHGAVVPVVIGYYPTVDTAKADFEKRIAAEKRFQTRTAAISRGVL